MYRVGGAKVWKPNAKARKRFNIELGADSFGIGVIAKYVRTTTGLGPHWKEHNPDEDNEVLIMDDGKVVLLADHRDN